MLFWGPMNRRCLNDQMVVPNGHLQKITECSKDLYTSSAQVRGYRSWLEPSEIRRPSFKYVEISNIRDKKYFDQCALMLTSYSMKLRETSEFQVSFPYWKLHEWSKAALGRKCML